MAVRKITVLIEVDVGNFIVAATAKSLPAARKMLREDNLPLKLGLDGEFRILFIDSSRGTEIVPFPQYLARLHLDSADD